MKSWLKTIIYLLTLLAIAVFVYMRRQNLSVLAEAPTSLFFVLPAFYLPPIFILSCQFKFNMSLFGLHLSFKEWFGLSVSNTMYNYFLPMRGGMVMRAMYLKKQHRFPYAQYMSFLSGCYLVSFTSTSFLALILGIFIRDRIHPMLNLAILCIFALMLTLLLLIYFRIFRISFEHSSRLFRVIKDAFDGLDAFRGPKNLAWLMGLQILFVIFMSLRLYFAFVIFHTPVNFIILTFIQALVMFSMILSITPGNLGIREGLIGLMGGLLGLTMEKTLLIAIFDRMAAMAIVIALGLVFSKLLLNEVGKEME